MTTNGNYGIPKLKDTVFKNNPKYHELRANYYLDRARGNKYTTNIFCDNGQSNKWSWSNFRDALIGGAENYLISKVYGTVANAQMQCMNGSSAMNSIFTVAGMMGY